MATSQNGYPAYNDTSHFVRGTVAGFSFWAADADVETIFTELITRFNTEVEAIAGKVLDDWSYADRNVRGSDTEVSNHSSATAIDLNALQHPRGKAGTFTKKKVTALRKILKDLPVLRWGGDYVNAVKDEMHFEINSSKAAVAANAAKIRDKNKPTPKKEDTVAISKEDAELIASTLLATQVVLTEAAARNMSTGDTPRKAGDKVSVSYLLQWGGAGLERVRDLVEPKSDQPTG